jgi:hypothetical protein
MIKEANKTIALSKSESTLLENDILHVFFLPNSLLEPIDFEEGKAIYTELGDGRKLRHLIEFGEYSTATTEARTWAEANSPAAIAEAIVIKSLAQGLLVRFYLKMRKNQHPCKVFRNSSEAKNWLNLN